MIDVFIIRQGEPEDAPFIGKTINEAMGHELCAGCKHCYVFREEANFRR